MHITDSQREAAVGCKQRWVRNAEMPLLAGRRKIVCPPVHRTLPGKVELVY